MATYYVSDQRGNNANSGTSPSAPWATLNYAAPRVSAGDTVYIGPGTYTEAWTIAASGTPSAKITWYGDPGVRYVTGDTPGRVRITGLDGSNNPQSVTLLEIASYQYNEFYYLYFDGTTNRCVHTNFTNGDTTNQFKDCCFCGGTYGVYGSCQLFKCSVSATYYACAFVTTTYCLVHAGYRACHEGVHTSTIAIGGDIGYRGPCTTKNCMALVGNYGYYGTAGSGVTATNCISLYCKNGFAGEASSSFTNCSALYCYVPFYGTDAGNLMVTTDCEQLKGYSASTNVTNQPTASKEVCTDWWAIVREFEPYLKYGLVDNGTNTGVNYGDIRERYRPAGNGTTDRGPWEFPNTSISFTSGDYETNPPGIRVTGGGAEVFHVALKKGDQLTVRCSCKPVNHTSDFPQLVLTKARVIDPAVTATHTAGNGVWQSLQVQAVAPEDCVVDVWLYVRENDVTHYALFSDLTTQVVTP